MYFYFHYGPSALDLDLPVPTTRYKAPTHAVSLLLSPMTHLCTHVPASENKPNWEAGGDFADTWNGLFLNGHNCQLLSNFGIMFKNWTMEIHVQLNYNQEGLDPGSATHHLVISSLLTVLSSAKRPKTMSVAWGVLRIK